MSAYLSKSRWMIRLFFCIFISVPYIPLVGQQNPGQPQNQENPQFKLSTRTNVVIVPVAVTDKHGDHVSGLTVNDFELKEDGKEQKIISFDEVTSDQSKVSAPALASNRFSNRVGVDHPKKLVVIAIDQINTLFDAGMEPKLVNFLSQQMEPNTLLALVALEPNGVLIIHSFTSDPAILIAAMRKVHLRATGSDTSSLYTANTAGSLDNGTGMGSAIDAEASELQALFSGQQSLTGLSGAQRIATARSNVRNLQATVDASRSSQNALVTLECLQQVAQYYAGVPGWKSLIWVTTGFVYSLGALPQSVTRGSTPDDWQRTMRALQDANMAVYAVDIGGLLTGGPPSNFAQLSAGNKNSSSDMSGRSAALATVESGSLIDPTAATHQTLTALADGSGGEAFYNANNASDLFHRAIEDSGRYYVLTYSTSNTAKAGWRKLSVKVRKEGVKVRSRNGFYFTDPGHEPDVTRQAEEVMALNSDLNFTSLPLDGEWEKTEVDGNQRKVHFVLLVPAGAATIDTEHENHLSLDIRIRAIDANGQPTVNVGWRLDRKLAPADAKEVQDRGVGYENVLTLPPGQYKVHFVVRDNLRGVMGNVVVPLKVE